MALNVGVNVIEVDGRANPTIQGAATSVAAMIGLAGRGVPNRPVAVRSAERSRGRFGGLLKGSFLAHAIGGFFANGGHTAHVSRVVGAVWSDLHNLGRPRAGDDATARVR